MTTNDEDTFGFTEADLDEAWDRVLDSWGVDRDDLEYTCRENGHDGCTYYDHGPCLPEAADALLPGIRAARLAAARAG